jgi:hypothetical protein
MILVTHGAGGALVAALLPGHPVLGSILAFGSHFVLDAIPHWHYPVRTLPRNHVGKREFVYAPIPFILDVVAVSGDGILGLLLPLLVSRPELLGVVFLGAFFGILPDFFQFLYHSLLHRGIMIPPLTKLQQFHRQIHAHLRLDDRPFVGIGSQALLLALLLIALRLL